MMKISVCMIVKDEEKFLGQCLDSVKGLADEIIIVDTGSADRTKEIAKEKGAAVIDYKWNDDTAKARNTGVEKAKGDWILVLDADETIANESFVPIRKLMEKEFDAYYLVQLNYTNSVNDLNFIPLQKKTPYSMDFRGYFPVEIIRFFRNRKGIRFTSIVHERLNDSIKQLGLKAVRTDVPIHHYQFLKGEEVMKKKQLAFLNLFEKKSKDIKDDPKMLHDMGILYYNYKNDEKKAIECFERAVKLKSDYIAPLFSLATVYARKKDNIKAKEMYHLALSINPENAAANYNLGNIYAEEKDYNNAILHYVNAVRIKPIVGAFNNLGNIYVMAGKWEGALEAFKAAIKFNHPRSDQLQKKVDEIEKMMEKRKA